MPFCVNTFFVNQEETFSMLELLRIALFGILLQENFGVVVALSNAVSFFSVLWLHVDTKRLIYLAP